MNTKKRNKKGSQGDHNVAGILCVIISSFFLICLITPLLSDIGTFVKNLTTGLIGYLSYPIALCTLLYGILLLMNKKAAFSGKQITFIFLIAACVIFILQTALDAKNMSGGFGEYISSLISFDANNTTAGHSVGGVIFGIFVFGIKSIISFVGAYILYSLLLILFCGLLIYDVRSAMRATQKANAQPQRIPFEKGKSSPQPVRDVYDPTLFVGTIEHTKKTVTQTGDFYSMGHSANAFGDAGNDAISHFDSARNQQTPYYEGPASDDDIHEMAKKKLYGNIEETYRNYEDALKRSMNIENASEQNGGSRRYNDDSVILSRPKPLMTSPSITPDQPKKIEREEKKTGLPEIPFLPEKDLSDQIVDGPILNGDQISETIKDSKKTVSEDAVGSEVVSTSEPEQEPELPPIIVGNPKPKKETVPEPEPEEKEPEIEQLPILNGDDFAKKEVKSEKQKQPRHDFWATRFGGAFAEGTEDEEEAEETLSDNEQSIAEENTEKENAQPPIDIPESAEDMIDDRSQDDIEAEKEETSEKQDENTRSDVFELELPDDDITFEDKAEGSENNEADSETIDSDINENPIVSGEKQNDSVIINGDNAPYDRDVETDDISDDIKEENSEDPEDNVIVDNSDDLLIDDMFVDDENEESKKEPVIDENDYSEFDEESATTNEGSEETDPEEVVSNSEYETVESEERSDNTNDNIKDESEDVSDEDVTVATEEIDDSYEEIGAVEQDEQNEENAEVTAADNSVDDSLESDEIKFEAKIPDSLKMIDEQIDMSEKGEEIDNDNTGYYNTEFEKNVSKISLKLNDDKFGLNKNGEVNNQINMDDYDVEIKETKPKKIKKPIQYNPPPIDLLVTESTDPDDGVDYRENATNLEEALHNFKINANVVDIIKGPAVVRYELQVALGQSVKSISNRAEDIAYSLAAVGKVRIEAPILGKRAVGVEVPKKEASIVALKDIINTEEFNQAKSCLTIALGRDISNQIVLCNLEKMPHLLIAGATGSGKSACLNSIIISFLYKASPDDVRLILIDPKQVEFGPYRNMPHLLMKNIINDSMQAINAFQWARDEMDRRYTLFAKYGVRNLGDFNENAAVVNGMEPKLPRIVIIVDELAELMISKNSKELEQNIMSMAQKARAAGMHLILATQRPSVDVLTGTIKANFTSRIAFAVKGQADSRTILDYAGAETLLGRGDMLYAPLGAKEQRVQGAFITTEEVESVVNYVKENNDVDYDEDAESIIMKKPEENIPAASDDGPSETSEDPLMKEVLKKVIEYKTASASQIQRKFSVGYNRAARLIDQMEENGYIGPLDGSKPREVYITREKYIEIYGEDIT